MHPNFKPSDKATLAGQISPGSQGTGTVTTGWVKASDFHQFRALLQVGTLGASATVDAKLEQATDGSGSGAKDVSGSDITQLTKAGSDDDKVVEINLDPSKLDVANAFDYVRLSVTVGLAASDLGAILEGFEARSGPADHIAAVDEVVTV